MRILLLFWMATIFCSKQEFYQFFLNPAVLRSWIADQYKEDPTVYNRIVNYFESLIKLQLTPMAVNEYLDDGNAFFPDLLLPFLQAVSRLTKEPRNDPVHIIELCAGAGFRIPPTIYAVDHRWPTCIRMHNCFPVCNKSVSIVNRHYKLASNYSLRIFFPAGNWVLWQHCPDYQEKFDLLNGYNLLHRLNPIEFLNFLKTVNYLLKKGGEAFLSGRGINLYSDRDPIVSFVNQRKELIKPFYGFVETVEDEFYKKNENGIFEPLFTSLISIKIQENSESFSGVTGLNCFIPQHSNGVFAGLDSLMRRRVSKTTNFMTPGIIQNAVQLFNLNENASLVIKESYFVDVNGIRIFNEHQAPNQNVGSVHVIISKQ